MFSEEVKKAILKEIEKDMTVADLEYLGLSLRVINILEDKGKIIYIKQLVKKSHQELVEIHQVGLGGMKQIINALNRILELDSVRNSWQKGSDRIDHYKSKISKQENNESIYA